MHALDRRTVAVLALLGATFAVGVIAVIGYGGYRQRPVQVRAFAVPYHQRVLDDPLEILLVQGDGQAFATLARDPSLTRADHELGTRSEGAYRAQRPLISYGAWALSLGRSGWVPPALAAIAIAGTALALVASGALLAARGGRPLFAALILLLPGFYASLWYMGPEPLAFGLAALGLLAWERERWWRAAILLSLAALGRETMLIVPGVLFLLEVAHGRLRRALPLLAAPAVYGAWGLVLLVRIGSLPSDAGDGRLSLPFRGLVDGLAGSTTQGGTAYAVLFFAIGLLAVVRAPRDSATLVGLAFLAFGSLMGERVWESWEYFGRVLLPGASFSLIALLGTFELARAHAGGAGSTPNRVALAPQHQ